MYAAALNAKGIKATTRPNIGSREVYLKAIQDGSVDIVPEYTGSLLNYLDKTATAKAPDEVYAALGKAVPTGLVALDKSAAEDKNSAALAAALNAVSAKLDTATLTKLVSQVDVDKKDAVAVAKAWVASVGLG